MVPGKMWKCGLDLLSLSKDSPAPGKQGLTSSGGGRKSWKLWKLTASYGLQLVLSTQWIASLHSSFSTQLSCRLVKGFYAPCHQWVPEQRVKLLRPDHHSLVSETEPPGSNTGLYPALPSVFPETASYHCFTSVPGQGIWAVTQHFFTLNQPTLNLFHSVELSPRVCISKSLGDSHAAGQRISFV